MAYRSETNTKNRDKKDLIAKNDQLEAKIASLADAISELKDGVAEMQKQLKRAGEDREKENLEFQQTVSEQRATQALLTKAMEVLKGFYEKGKKGVALVQQAPPAGFKTMEKNSGGGGVIRYNELG